MNTPLSPKKTLALLIFGLIMCLLGIAGMLFFRWYFGLIILVPLAVFYVWQLVQQLQKKQ